MRRPWAVLKAWGLEARSRGPSARRRHAARPDLERCECRLVLTTVAIPNAGPPQRATVMARGLREMPFEGNVLQGPDQGASLKGILQIKPVGDEGFVRGRLDPGEGPDVRVTGRVVGRRIGLRFPVGEGQVFRAVGRFQRRPLAGGGFNLTGDGRFTGPEAADRGTWGVGYSAGVHIQLDYSLDTNHFFDDPARRELLQMAADAVTNRLIDTLTAIVAPQPVPGTSFSNTWTAQVSHPATGASFALSNLNVPRDTIIVFAGGRDLPAPTVGQGGPGGFAASGTQAFLDNIRARGQGTRPASGPPTGALASPPTDVGPWGGSITFDTVGTNWFFGTTFAGITSGQTDFLSVATHELGHLLGINSSPAFTRHIVNGVFTGPVARAANGGANVPVATGGSLGHWAEGVRNSPPAGQEVALDPSLLNGTRKLFTALDFAGLQDVGWQVSTI